MRTAFAIVLGLAALAAGISVVVDHGSGVGAAAGLMLGVLLGPARIAGVDFRQWLRNPGTPSELGDDSPIGLMRSGFAAVGGSAALAFAALVVATASAWMPVAACPSVDASAVLGILPDRLYLPDMVRTFVGFLNDCSATPAMVKLAGGAVVGLVAAQAVVDATWRLGLVFGVPHPARPRQYLSSHRAQRVRTKEDRPGRRRIIVCCDGTWNRPESRRETNVVRLVRAIAPDDQGTAQIVHYHQGVGTGNFIDRIAGGGAGIGLSASVKACYGFLVDNYRPHDDIFLFGFSRGAYVVRALGGLIGTVGMVRKYEMERFADVWDWYWQEKAQRNVAVLDYLAPDRYRDVDIECIGVWDTVGALGIPGSRFCAKTYAFHETALGPHVRYALQALAIDETRGNFQGAVWVSPAAPEGAEAPAEPDQKAPREPEQVLEQVWFPGVHSNIGGGYPRHGLSDAAFLWMLSKLEEHQLLALDQRSIVAQLDDEPTERYPAGAMQDSRTRVWRLVGCPVPRPICIISDTERVHESAWERRDALARLVPDRDIYKRWRRRGWLEAMDGPPPPALQVERSPFEMNYAEEAGLMRARPTPNIPRKRDVCSWLMHFFGAR